VDVRIGAGAASCQGLWNPANPLGVRRREAGMLSERALIFLCSPRQDLTFASNETILLNRTARLRLFCSPEESEGLPLRRTHVEMARTGSAGLFGCGDDTDTADDSGMTDTDTDTDSDEFEPRQTKAPSPFGRCMVTNS
jgi:hypothetical protein